jgi:pilus assembly protein CpaB
MNRKALIIAAVFAVFGVVLMLIYQRKFETEKSGGERIALLSLKKTVERGAILSEDSLAERLVPFAYVEGRAIRASDKARIVGLKVAGKMQAQDTLMWSDIVTSGADRQDLSTTLAPGMRAKTIRVNKEDSSIGLIRPGDLVDVIAVLGPANSESKTAVVLMQRVIVVAVGTQTSNDSLDRRDTTNDDTITVSVELKEAQILDLAADRGRLSVALRRRDDTEQSRGLPDVRSDSLLAPTARPATGHMSPLPVATSKEIDLNGRR